MAARGLKLLFDENFSHRQVEFIGRESRLAQMQHIHKIGWSGRPDTEWIPLAVQQEFVIVSGDRNAKTRGYSAADLTSMQARVLLLSSFWDHMTGWQRAQWLVSRIERLVEASAALPQGTVWLVNRIGQAKSL